MLWKPNEARPSNDVVGGWRTDSLLRHSSIIGAQRWEWKGVNPRLLASGSCSVEKWIELHPAGAQNIKASNATNKLSWKEVSIWGICVYCTLFFIGKITPFWRCCSVMVGLEGIIYTSSLCLLLSCAEIQLSARVDQSWSSAALCHFIISTVFLRGVIKCELKAKRPSEVYFNLLVMDEDRSAGFRITRGIFVTTGGFSVPGAPYWGFVVLQRSCLQPWVLDQTSEGRKSQITAAAEEQGVAFWVCVHLKLFSFAMQMSPPVWGHKWAAICLTAGDDWWCHN